MKPVLMRTAHLGVEFPLFQANPHVTPVPQGCAHRLRFGLSCSFYGFVATIRGSRNEGKCPFPGRARPITE